MRPPRGRSRRRSSSPGQVWTLSAPTRTRARSTRCIPLYNVARGVLRGEGRGHVSGTASRYDQMSNQLLILTAFLASLVEMVEALTIILAAGLTRGWRSALLGAAAGLVVLAVIVAVLGPTLIRIVPLAALQIVIGALLLIFGLQWLRKAILRAAGLKDKHDEALEFQQQVAALSGPPAERSGIDWTGFVVAFKGMLLEGLEVAFIVLTFGLQAGR